MMVFMECGCRTYMSDHPNLFVPMVEYCPMHKAAPEMFEALRFYADVAIVEDDGGERARQAIAKAKVKETGDNDRST